MNFDLSDTIVALATAPGTAAIAVIRVSGQNAIELIEPFFYTRSLKKKSLVGKPSHMAHFGLIVKQNEIIDEVLLTTFKGPNSYTGQDSIEISCHGSLYIQQQLLQLILSAGARMAQPGEFTMRAYLNGKMDLSQAEAVADLIAGNSSVSHATAMKQMRGGFSSKIKALRDNLINFAALIELELDFSEEDVEFADRSDLKNLVHNIAQVVETLVKSFELGNVLKNGIPVVIVGKPNAGKSTLLNVLLNDERAIVSEIPGTTRDTIEDTLLVEGVLFRLIDTAGLRTTSDVIEQIGVHKALQAIQNASIVVYLFDVQTLSPEDLTLELAEIKEQVGNAQVLIVANKMDVEDHTRIKETFNKFPNMLYISAKETLNIDVLKQKLLGFYDAQTIEKSDTIVTNARHANSLQNAGNALNNVLTGLENKIPGDLLALDIRYALTELGQITGEVTNDDLLETIFRRFCIGK
jgi:tRNA modification GTPase